LLLTGSVRAELSNELWAGTGRVVRTTMYGLTAREINGDVAPTQPPFLTRLARGAVETFRLPTVPPTIDDYLALAVRGSLPAAATGVPTLDRSTPGPATRRDQDSCARRSSPSR